MIDDMISSESDNKNIKRLNGIKNDLFIINWPIKNRSDINNNVNKLIETKFKLDTMISDIYKKYSAKYNKLKEKGAADIEGKKFSLETDPIKIYVGSSNSNTKSVHLPLTNLKINDFLNKSVTSKYSYNIIDRTLLVKRTDTNTGWSNKLTLYASINNSYRDHNPPLITKSKPLKLYSAGAENALEETVNRSNLIIENDEGHNLFMGTNDKTIPKFAYKIKKECLFPKIAKPIIVNNIPGVLDDFNNERDKRLKSEDYFTFPMNIIIESKLGDKNSPLGEPKKYYLTYINKKKIGDSDTYYPIYIIRAIDESTMEYSKFKVINKENKIVNMPIDTNNINGKWAIRTETVEKESVDHPSLTPDNGNPPFTIIMESLADIQGGGLYFSQEYDKFGNSLEEVKDNTTSLSGQWTYHRLQ
jgi:hypothetical protein